MHCNFKVELKDKEVLNAVKEAVNIGVHEAGDELLAISNEEVPFNIGTLSKSGRVDNNEDLKSKVGYYMPYAHRLHEHPEFKFQNGRKGKYLEEPLLRNTNKFKEIISSKCKDVMK